MEFYEVEFTFQKIGKIFKGIKKSDDGLYGTDDSYEKLNYSDADIVVVVKDITANSIKNIVINKFGDKLLMKHLEPYLKLLMDDYGFENVTVETFSEITGSKFVRTFSSITNSLRGSVDIEDSFTSVDINNCFSHSRSIFKEWICKYKFQSLEQILEIASDNLAHRTLVEEIQRIYQNVHKEFYGSPVHYILDVASSTGEDNIIEILFGALRSNDRLCSNRIIRIDFGTLDECFGFGKIDAVLKTCYGNLVVLDTRAIGGVERRTSFADSVEEIVAKFRGIISRLQNDVVFLLLKSSDNNMAADMLLRRLRNEVVFIELQEGVGNKDQAEKYLYKLISKSKYKSFVPNDFLEILNCEGQYSAADIGKTLEKWEKNVVRDVIYPAYKQYKTVEIAEEKIDNSSYEELQDMIGLTKVKEVINGIIHVNKINKLRRDMGIVSKKMTQHMLFTGNPGSAKTTVARIMAKILFEEGVQQSGKFVECGRSDLVARYVGWTAKQVKEKFSEARGGVLFIDEAYSLVDDSNSFGDEAIGLYVG